MLPVLALKHYLQSGQFEKGMVLMIYLNNKNNKYISEEKLRRSICLKEYKDNRIMISDCEKRKVNQCMYQVIHF